MSKMSHHPELIRQKLPNSLVFIAVMLARKKTGFTLLELIIVMIIISVLAMVSIPVFQGQIGKSREAEVKLKLGAIARSQTAYHYVNGNFAPTLSVLASDSGPISSFYYTFDEPTSDSVKVKHQAIAVNSGFFLTRNYAIGVYYDGGAYGRATCQGFDVGEEVNVGDFPSEDCTNSGIKLE